jgi:hypothetical protein
MKRFMNKKLLVVGVVVALILGIGGAAFAYFTTTGSGTGSAPIGSASPLTVALGTGSFNHGATGLLPAALTDGNAVIETVPYTVTNEGEGDVGLTSVQIDVTPGFTYTDAASDPACTAADFSLNGQLPGTPVTVTGLNLTLNGVSDAPNNAYASSFTIQMVENGANQDSCEGGSVPLTVTANPNLLTSIDYYTWTNPAFVFSRSVTPIVTGAVADSYSGGDVNLSITDAVGYTDTGFYIVLGTLGSLHGYTINGTGNPFGTNLYLGTNSGEFFNWNDNVYTGVPGNTAYGLGPGSSGGTITVNGSSLFGMQNASCSGYSYGTTTLADLQAGDCTGITASTPVAIWVGLTLGSGGTGTTTITSVTAY